APPFLRLLITNKTFLFSITPALTSSFFFYFVGKVIQEPNFLSHSAGSKRSNPLQWKNVISPKYTLPLMSYKSIRASGNPFDSISSYFFISSKPLRRLIFFHSLELGWPFVKGKWLKSISKKSNFVSSFGLVRSDAINIA